MAIGAGPGAGGAGQGGGANAGGASPIQRFGRAIRPYAIGAVALGAIILGIRGCDHRQPYPSLMSRNDILTVETVELHPNYYQGRAMGAVGFVTARNGQNQLESYPLKISKPEARNFGLRAGEQVIRNPGIEPDEQGYYRTTLVLTELTPGELDDYEHLTTTFKHPKDKPF